MNNACSGLISKIITSFVRLQSFDERSSRKGIVKLEPENPLKKSSNIYALSEWIQKRRQGNVACLDLNVECLDLERRITCSVFGEVRTNHRYGFVVFWSGGLPPYYAPVIAILNSEGRFDQKTTSFKANVPNMNFFCKVPNEKCQKYDSVTYSNCMLHNNCTYFILHHNCTQIQLQPK